MLQDFSRLGAEQEVQPTWKNFMYRGWRCPRRCRLLLRRDTVTKNRLMLMSSSFSQSNSDSVVLVHDLETSVRSQSSTNAAHLLTGQILLML